MTNNRVINAFRSLIGVSLECLLLHAMRESVASGASRIGESGASFHDIPELERRRVLLIDRDAAFAIRCAGVIHARGWQVEIAADPAVGLSVLLQRRHDLALLALDFLPDSDGAGLELCRAIRGAGSAIAIIILTAKPGPLLRLEARNAGADACIAREQYGDEEMALRFEDALLWSHRRSSNDAAYVHATVRVGPLTVSPATETVLLQGAPLHLPRVERKLLVYMSERHGTVVAPRELCLAAGIQPDPFHRNLGNAIRRLRRRLGETHAGLIQNVRGHGYRFHGSDVQNCIQKR